jgi:hypothetical protein
MDKILKWFFAIWFIWLIVCLSVVGGLIWAAVHFITKYW